MVLAGSRWNSWHRNTIERLIEAYKLIHTKDDIVTSLQAALEEIDLLSVAPQTLTDEQKVTLEEGLELLIGLRNRPVKEPVSK